MVQAIREDRTPSLFALHYDLTVWRVRSLILIPRFAYSLKDIIRRRPLSPQAERHGWVGCDILLNAIPHSARISVIEDGVPSKPRNVRQQFQRLKPLKRIRTSVRGWTLDVFRAVESLGKRDFSLPEVYAFEEELRQLHPGNRFITPKIRQQLQRLRDLGLLEFLGSGRYRLT
jgi:type II restriction enzyme